MQNLMPSEAVHIVQNLENVEDLIYFYLSSKNNANLLNSKFVLGTLCHRFNVSASCFTDLINIIDLRYVNIRSFRILDINDVLELAIESFDTYIIEEVLLRTNILREPYNMFFDAIVFAKCAANDRLYKFFKLLEDLNFKKRILTIVSFAALLNMERLLVHFLTMVRSSKLQRVLSSAIYLAAFGGNLALFKKLIILNPKKCMRSAAFYFNDVVVLDLLNMFQWQEKHVFDAVYGAKSEERHELADKIMREFSCREESNYIENDYNLSLFEF